MKIGLSTYSLLDAIEKGEMTVLDAIEWIKENGGEHVEIVPFGFKFDGNEELADAIREKAKEVGIDVSNYSILADFLKDDEEEYKKEIKRVMREVDIAHRLGVKYMRHDVSSFRRPFEKNTIIHFEKDLPRMVEACRIIADYAAQYGITTTVENHGFYVNGGDRVLRLIDQVDRPNFKCTLDVGNFLCVDEDPIANIKKLLPYTVVIHMKDFYWRKAGRNPGVAIPFHCAGGTWFQTVSGNFIRGSIVGYGDLDIWEIVRIIKSSGFDGYISVEFEGLEDYRIGSKIGMDNLRRIWNEV
jgi:sugar phosphate isomerase/epimerase